MPDNLSIPKKRGSIIGFKAVAIFLLILGSLIFAPRAFADVLYSQGVVDTQSSSGNVAYQELGNGLSGVPNQIQWSVDFAGSFIPGDWAVQLLGYANSNYTSQVVGDTNFVITDVSSVGTTHILQGTSGAPLTLNSAYYYSIWFIGYPTGDMKLNGSAADLYPAGSCSGAMCGLVADVAFNVCDSGSCSFAPPTPPDTSTRIVDFTPENNATTTNPVTFSLHAFINPDDISGNYSIQFILHNVDQNVFLLSGLSPSDIYLLNGVFATTSGDYYFSTSTIIGAGNYTLEATLTQFVGFGTSWWNSIQNPLSSVNQFIYHRFIVCDPGDTECKGTIIGNLQQNGYDILAGIAGESTGTTTATSTLATCNPISTNYATAFLNTGFSVTKCALALFTPDGVLLNNSIKQLHDGVLTRIPFGYLTRSYDLFSSAATSSLPTWTATFQTAASSTESLTFDMGDMLAGGASLLDSIHDPINNKTPRDVFEPMVQLAVALMVVFTIIADLMGSHRHNVAMGKQTKLS
jgi:hypothetical protein